MRIKVLHNEVEDWESNDYIPQARTARKITMVKLKEHSIQLEDDVWCMFYKLGFDKLNLDENLRVQWGLNKEDAYAILESIAKISGTTDRLTLRKPTGQEKEEEMQAEEARENAKRSAFRFSLCNFKPGEKVVFIEDSSIQPVVIDDRRIEWNGQTTSLSALAQQLKGFNHAVQGTLWFTYSGIKLTDLREQMEK